MNNTVLNLSFRNLRPMIEKLCIFTDVDVRRYSIIKSLKINEKRAIYLVHDIHNNSLKVLKFILQINMTDEQKNDI